MAESPLPEMLRLSLSDLALRIKVMKVRLGTSIEDVLARALDPPVSINVQRAVSMLVEVLNALSNQLHFKTTTPPGSSPNSVRGNISDGQTIKQTPNRCSSRKIPPYCNSVPLSGPCFNDSCNTQLQITLYCATWT